MKTHYLGYARIADLLKSARENRNVQIFAESLTENKKRNSILYNAKVLAVVGFVVGDECHYYRACFGEFICGHEIYPKIYPNQRDAYTRAKNSANEFIDTLCQSYDITRGTPVFDANLTYLEDKIEEAVKS